MGGKLFTRTWLRLKALAKRKQLDRDLDDELQFHVAKREEKLAATGFDAQESHYAARRQFGNTTSMREATREMWTIRWLENLWQDLRYGARVLRKNPGFTATAILTLALGIGANTAIFSVVDTILLRPLPYRETAGIVFVAEEMPHDQARPERIVSLIDYERRYPEVISEVSAMNPVGPTLTGVPRPERVGGEEVSSEYFEILGWRPALGRSFLLDDEKAGAAPVVILSDALWRRDLGSDPHAIGRMVLLDNVAHMVVGIMPRSFENPIYKETDIWLPIPLGQNQFQWLAKLAPGGTISVLESRMQLAEQTLEGHGPGWQAEVSSLRDMESSYIRPSLLILLACASFVLLVACTNVANLLLARGAGRRLETTVRCAVGASRRRIAQQMLTESVLLGSMGGAAGVAVAYWTLKLMIAAVPRDIVRLDVVHIDGRILWFAAAISVLTSLLFGVLPAMRLTRVDLAAALKEGMGTGAAAGVGHSRVLSVLVGCEVALAVMLMLGASLMMRSFLRLLPSHPGFDPTHKLSVMLEPAARKYPSLAQRQLYMEQIVERIRALPNVTGVAATDFLPFSGVTWTVKILARPGAAGVQVNTRQISPNYFQVMEIPMLSGRTFSDFDAVAAQKVAVISQGTAEQCWPGENPLGKHFTALHIKGEFEVVGVTADIREAGMSLKRWPEFYLPIWQKEGPPILTLVVSSRTEETSLANSVRSVILSVDKDQALFNVRTFDELLSASVSTVRFEAYLVGAFAGIALLLASVGIYGVISYTVKRRTREMGIRIALGASSRQVTRAALGATMIPVAVGLVVGWLAAFWLSRLLTSVLYGLSPTDAAANFAAVAVLCVVAGFASYIPARKAARVDPAVALRHD
jgi:putative ABC transport system permease protein